MVQYNLKLTCTFPCLNYSSTLPKEKVGKGKVQEESKDKMRTINENSKIRSSKIFIYSIK
ncbi:hypothetical protein BpHYR1_024661 [Brachionus plicatilis]|uniref:Uncharacterized protein n=1 Tax=Brachionus plicatilis TaxID=10195 RepID=A0A3M7R0U7_BRAPC|nr:hypothetical protein BpHYR1_024661 [Brachionus plicatilis]